MARAVRDWLDGHPRAERALWMLFMVACILAAAYVDEGGYY